MAKCNQLTLLPFKGLNQPLISSQKLETLPNTLGSNLHDTRSLYHCARRSRCIGFHHRTLPFYFRDQKKLPRCLAAVAAVAIVAGVTCLARSTLLNRALCCPTDLIGCGWSEKWRCRTTWLPFHHHYHCQQLQQQKAAISQIKSTMRTRPRSLISALIALVSGHALTAAAEALFKKLGVCRRNGALHSKHKLQNLYHYHASHLLPAVQFTERVSANRFFFGSPSPPLNNIRVGVSLEYKREYCQNCSVLDCVTQCS